MLARSDILTPAAWDRARELGLTVVYNDDPASDLPAWSGAAQRVRSGKWLPEHAPGPEQKTRPGVAAPVAKIPLPVPPSTDDDKPRLVVSLLEQTTTGARSIITESELRQHIRQPQRGVSIIVTPGTRFSPAAHDFIKQWQVEVVSGH